MCGTRSIQPLTGEQLVYTTTNTQDGTRLGIVANGMWGGGYEKTYFDVRFFNPHALPTGTISYLSFITNMNVSRREHLSKGLER